MDNYSEFDRYLESLILRERGQNQELAEEILEKLSPESKEKLFRIFQNQENEMRQLKNKLQRTSFGMSW